MPKKAILSSARRLIYGRNSKYHFEESSSSLDKPRDQKRTFTKYQKNEILYQQDGKCASTLCHHRKLDPKEVQFEHKKPWAFDGRVVMQYGRVVCLDCHSNTLKKETLRKTSRKRKQKSVLFF